MPNFKALRGSGSYFPNAYLGYMASETVISHNVIVSGQLPEAHGLGGRGLPRHRQPARRRLNSMQITGDLSLAQFQTLVSTANYPKLADYLHATFPGTKFITVGEKSYAVESASTSSDSRRPAPATSPCGCPVGRQPKPGVTPATRARRPRRAVPLPGGRNVPSYLLDASRPLFTSTRTSRNDYGTATTPPAYLYPEDGNRFVPGSDPSALAGHLGGDTWAADAAIAMMASEKWSGMFVTLGGIDKAGHMWGADQDPSGHDCTVGTGQVHVDCMAKNADIQLGKMLDELDDPRDLDDTLVILTADHGATHAANFFGKDAAGASDSNWYWAPDGVWDGGAFINDATYNNPSPALLPLNATDNLQFSYQSTAIESWLYDTSLPQLQAEAAVMKTLPGVIASYYKVGDHFVLAGTNPMSWSERKWWLFHGQEIVNTMAAPSGPDVVGLLHDDTTYSVYGDHGGAAEEVQRVPMVFWQSGDARVELNPAVPDARRPADDPAGDGDPAHAPGRRPRLAAVVVRLVVAATFEGGALSAPPSWRYPSERSNSVLVPVAARRPRLPRPRPRASRRPKPRW